MSCRASKEVRAFSEMAMKHAERKRQEEDAALSPTERLEHTLTLSKFISELRASALKGMRK